MIEFTIKHKGIEYACMIDHEDADLLEVAWHIQLSKTSQTVYIRRNGAYKTGRKRDAVLMHRVIMARILQRPLLDDEIVDHRSNIGTNNTRENLRLATKTQNKVNSCIPKNNTTGVKGVMWNRKLKKYQAHMRLNGKQKHLGLYETLEEAHKARTKAMTEAYGEFVRE